MPRPIIPAALAVMLSFLIAGCTGNRFSGELPTGRLAPEITGQDLDGQAFELSDYRGKVVVLDFWGHW